MTCDIPGPRPWPFLGNLLDIDLENSVQSVVDIGKQYAPICRLRLGGEDKVFVTGHELAKELCSRRDFVKFPAGAVGRLRDVMTEGLFTAHDDEWFWGPAHRVLVPALGPMSIKAMFPEMHDIAMQMVLRWARFGEDEVIDATSDFTRLTIDTLALCGMDMRLNSFYKDNLHPFIGSMMNVLIESSKRAERPDWFTSLFFRAANRQFDRDNAFLHAVAQEVIDKRRRAPESDKKDLLDAMLNGKDPQTGEKLTDRTVVDNMITFLIAGHETTACMLGFFFALVIRNPECYNKVREEVDTVVGIGPVQADHMSRLVYVKACLREALRLYPPSAGFSLAVKGDDAKDGPVIIGGKYKIKHNQPVFVVLPNIHRDPEVWGSDVDEFRPERMLDENFKKLPPGCYKPFGNGKRGCIGSDFAMQESILAIALLFQKFDFKFVNPDYELTVKQTLTLKPRDLFMYAKLRPGINALTLQKEMLSGAGSQDTPAIKPKALVQHLLAEKQQALKPFRIFYGSNTGTCQGLAEILKTTAPQHGFDATVQPLDVAKDNLEPGTPIVLITSTMYEGQAPDNGAEFLNWLEEEGHGLSLDGVTFAVFGCGSKDWKDTFQRTAITIDQILRDCGAHCIASRGAADVSEGSVLSDFDAWQSEHLWPGIARIYDVEENIDPEGGGFDINRFCSVLAQDSFNTFDAPVERVMALTESTDRPKYHMELQLPDNMDYQVGDYLELVPQNSVEDVECLMGVLGDRGHDLADPTIPVICSHLELRQQASAKQIDLLLQHCGDKDERQELEALTAAVTVQGRRPSVLQLMKRYSSIDVPLQRLATMLPPIRPRLYSISSSPLADPRSLTITWSLIQHDAPHGWTNEAPLVGLASGYLASLKAGDMLKCSIRSGQPRFRPPMDLESTPIVMICAGSGIAPFRGFVQDRVERLRCDASLTEQLAPALLYVGCRGPDQALYAAEMQEWQESGAVDIRYVYSRHGVSPEAATGYVQDRIWEDREELVKVWEKNAKIFVCGGRPVSHGVRNVVQNIYREQANDRCGLKTDTEVEKWWVEILRDRCAVEVF
ncbi:P450 family fatty acid hydroxylase [Coniella lustricola]|uniref:Bifunctional cytochrome P450/NADPH--P450 reductase n=1 Tax=Coniella lustricola TaxID=2025994 RepID=A0A2T3ANC5_9PEZI|nr:P450 family fatty acid hydroxylase [Coniella lustricola]